MYVEKKSQEKIHDADIFAIRISDTSPLLACALSKVQLAFCRYTLEQSPGHFPVTSRRLTDKHPDTIIASSSDGFIPEWLAIT
jgi:hypothetical protein